MFFLYNTLIQIASQVVKFLALFNPKLKLFVNGRKNVFSQLQNQITKNDKTIWFHAASLGEYEQGLPVMEAVKIKFPNHKIVLTFFSPSGFEIKKNNSIAYLTLYLPLDSKSNAKKFIEILNPEMVFFIKYEFWPNYLNQLKKKQIKTYLISGIFRKNQAFFKWYGGFYRKALTAFTYFFVQNESSKNNIESIGFKNVKISGDTRFDRVSNIVNANNQLIAVEQFKHNKELIVIGSSWPKDIEILTNFINKNQIYKYIIAPHNIKENEIIEMQKKLQNKSLLYSNLSNYSVNEIQNTAVLIVNSIGILTKLYSYANIAYVGGGFGNPGVHNILEPATFGIPIVIGPNFNHFAEAVALVHQKGCVSIKNQNELAEIFNLLLQNISEQFEKGHICKTFVQMNIGATKSILNSL